MGLTHVTADLTPVLSSWESLAPVIPIALWIKGDIINMSCGWHWSCLLWCLLTHAAEWQETEQFCSVPWHLAWAVTEMTVIQCSHNDPSHRSMVHSGAERIAPKDLWMALTQKNYIHFWIILKLMIFICKHSKGLWLLAHCGATGLWWFFVFGNGLRLIQLQL